MSSIQYPPVYIGLYVLLVSAVSAITSAAASGPVSLASMLFWAVLYGVGLGCGWKYNQHKSEAFKMVSNIIAVLVLFLFVISIFASFERAFLVLLIGIQAARNFTLATRRDFYYSYVISLVLVLYAASVSKQGLFIFYMLVYVLAGVFTLMAGHIDETLSRARGGDRDVLIRRMNLPVKGAGLSAAIIFLSLVFYFVVPRPASPQLQAFPAGGGWTYQNKEWERQAKEDERRGPGRMNQFDVAGMSRILSNNRHDAPPAGSAEYGGVSRQFDIADCSCTLSDDLLFYLQSDRPLYVRAKTFDFFDGRNWMKSRESRRKISNKNGFSLDENFREYGASQIFTIESDMTSHILAAYRPVRLWFPGSVIELADDLSLTAPSVLRKGTIYSVLSEVGDRDGRPVSIGEYPGDMEQYLQLPDTLSQRVKELGAGITQNIEDVYAKAVEIERYLKTNYVYTLNTVLKQPGQNVVDEFLFDLKQGHCEYFATAMVVMLRSINIPARLATGYAAYRENTITGYYEVRRKNGHAWVEAYIEGYGWVTFEPTSSFELPRGSRGMFAAAGVLKYMEDRVTAAINANSKTWWARAMEKILAFFKAFWRMLQELFAYLLNIGEHILIWLVDYGWKALLAILFVAGGAHLIYQIVVPIGEKIDREQVKKKDARQFIIHCYKEVEKVLSRKNLPRLPFHAPLEYEPIVAARFSHLATSLAIITRLFNRSRYSSLPVNSEDADNVYKAYKYIMEFIHKKPEERGGPL